MFLTDIRASGRPPSGSPAVGVHTTGRGVWATSGWVGTVPGTGPVAAGASSRLGQRSDSTCGKPATSPTTTIAGGRMSSASSSAGRVPNVQRCEA